MLPFAFSTLYDGRSGDDAPVRQHDDKGSVRRVETHDEEAVTGEIFRERREVRRQSAPSGSEQHNRICTLSGETIASDTLWVCTSAGPA